MDRNHWNTNGRSYQSVRRRRRRTAVVDLKKPRGVQERFSKEKQQQQEDKDKKPQRYPRKTSTRSNSRQSLF